MLMWEWFTTKEGNIALGALLGVGGSVIVQAVTGIVAIVKEVWFSRRQRRWDARHLALRTVLILDDFVGQCYNAAFDSPEFDPKDASKFKFRNRSPNLVMPEDADWRLLEPRLMEEVMWLPSRFQNVVDGLSALDRSPPDFDDYFEHRSEDYARLGKRSLEIIDLLCSEYGIAKPKRPHHYDPAEGFDRKIEEMGAFWKERQEAQSKMWAEFLSPAPPGTNS